MKRTPKGWRHGARALLAAMALAALAGEAAAGDVVDGLLAQYRAQGAEGFDAARGKALWESRHMQSKLGEMVSCASCHTSDLAQAGRHLRTGKRIEPMSPAVNPERLTDAAKIEKWFRRNCRWTLGRVCTPQEKGDVLMFIKGN